MLSHQASPPYSCKSSCSVGGSYTTPVRVVLIVGVGHSGSTLLDLILGSHSRVVGVGELIDFDKVSQLDSLCACWRRMSTCRFWTEVMRRLPGHQAATPFMLQPPNAASAEVIANTVALYRSIEQTASARYVVDSSKRWRRARVLSQQSTLDVRAIHLLRDGRGVGYSHARRGESFEDAVTYWGDANLAIRCWLDEVGHPPFITLRYEDLVTDPEGTIGMVCSFLALPWEAGILNFFSVEHHNISGNLMRLVGDEAIVLDEAWRQVLTSQELATFERLVGSAAARLGY
jgi:hypothetical protein